MKKINLIFVMIFLALIITSCNNKTKDMPEIIIGESEIFTEKEISDAIDVVIKQYQSSGCTLEKVYYDEEFSKKFQKTIYITEGTSDENVIDILADFYPNEDNPVLSPNTLYEKYSWILIRNNENSNWEIFSQGY